MNHVQRVLQISSSARPNNTPGYGLHPWSLSRYQPGILDKWFSNDRALELLVDAYEAVFNFPSFPDEEYDDEHVQNAKQALTDVANKHSVAFVKVVQALRVAITGREVGVGIYDTLHILGRQEVGKRVLLVLDSMARKAEIP
jgi:hypothetical protein